MQVGCGVGNAALPLLEQNPTVSVHACDFSAKAVQLLKESADYDPARITAFVADLTTDSLGRELPAEGVDLCTMLFVLSAIDPELMHKASPASGHVTAGNSGPVGLLALPEAHMYGHQNEPFADSMSTLTALRQHHPPLLGA